MRGGTSTVIYLSIITSVCLYLPGKLSCGCFMKSRSLRFPFYPYTVVVIATVLAMMRTLSAQLASIAYVGARLDTQMSAVHNHILQLRVKST